ncbi:MAG: 30S ribosomal protein S6 [Clostridia bacterium]|nr:30S ribosomal protein S6 [Clostridia bacterium]
MSQVINSYESVVIFSLKLGEEGINALIEKFTALIEKNGTLGEVEHWGKRRLAYLINKEPEGYYVLFNFKSAPEFPAELNRIYRITDGVLRSLTINKDD